MEDLDEQVQAEMAALDRFGLTPAALDLPMIREGLIREIEAVKCDDENVLLMRLHCIQLFSHGQAADAVLIWRAKRSSFDAGCGIDVQLLCGACVEATKAALGALNDPEAREALTYLCECEHAGDFADWTPAQTLAFHRQYYGLP
ncbi:hypothetical protein [uncultured Deinococcus sp.]|uniref:hypothetical protein n=1 Tax=uncultured Deinococcus sp. TaxID=158789 RepID=UPI0025CF17D0|nr:hypothetical protein [uncultured Deinococcus sp.]